MLPLCPDQPACHCDNVALALDVFMLCRPECAEHGMKCFARLVRLLLGPSAISDRKLAFGASLEILGVEVILTDKGYTARPSKRTIKKCLRVLEKALAEDSLPSGAAQKLAGRLNWAGQHLFHRLGRAMLRALYNQKRSACAACLSSIRLAP